MAQGFYNLEEAAARLGMPEDELNQMAQKREVRAFADRGTWRFREQDVEELARQRGMSSDPDLQLGDTGPSEESDDAFDIFVQDDKEAGSGSDSDVRLVAEGNDLTLKPDSDSDVRLDTESDDPVIAAAGGSDSDIKLVSESDSDVKVAPAEADNAISHESPPASQDSDIRLDPDVPLGSDSDIRLVEDEPAADDDDAVLSMALGEDSSEEEPLILAEDSLAAESPPTKDEPGADDSLGSDFELTPLGTEDEYRAGLSSPADSDVALEVESESAGEEALGSSDDDMNFELSLDDSDAEAEPAADGEEVAAESSEEFELDLDDIELSPMDDSDDETVASDVDGGVELEDSDLESPLSEDTDLEGSSEFELAIGDDDELTMESDESGEVEVIDDDSVIEDLDETEEVDADDLEELEVIDDELEDVDELEGAAVDEILSEDEEVFGEGESPFAGAGVPVLAAPAEWGMLPTLLLLPATVVMMLTGFLLYEMLQSIWSYNEPGFISGPLSEMLGGLL